VPTQEPARRGTDRRTEIIDCSATLFARHGVSNASLADIAAVVGIKKGSLYYFFESKEALLHDVLLPVVEEPYRRLKEIVDGPGDPIEKITEGMASLGRAFGEHPERMQILVRERLHQQLSAEAYEEIRSWKAAYTQLWEQLIRDAVDSGLFAELDEKIAAFGLIGAMNWMYAWFDPAGDLSGEEVGRRLAMHFLAGYLADSATTARRRVRRQQAALRAAAAARPKRSARGAANDR